MGLMMENQNVLYTIRDAMEQSIPIWQIVVWIITALISIITFFSQFAIKSALAKLKRHDDKLDDHESRIGKNEAAILANADADKYRMDALNQSFKHIQEGITDIKRVQSDNATEIKQLDKRVTDFIIETTRNIGRAIHG